MSRSVLFAGALTLACCCLFHRAACAARPDLLAPTGSRSAPAAAPQRPHPAVVRVIVPEGAGTSYGSGTLVDVRGEYGLVLTNWHVVADAAGTIEVVFPDGFRSAARLITTDRIWDLAALAIWRPRAQPVPLAAAAPQPGDPLTIAGYGSGTYRAVTGHCTQYVAPGMNKPYEMVELSVSARQGDSGGPIFNSRGELAGVLFGSGWGTTSGSYCRRVSTFLVGVVPAGDAAERAALAATQPTAPPPPLVPVQFSAPVAQAHSAGGLLGDRPMTSAREPAVARPRDAARPAAAEAETAPASLGEQIEMFLAFVGGAAILMHGLRLLMPAR